VSNVIVDDVVPKYDVKVVGQFMVGVHQKNVSPQNHFQDITLNDHYIYEIIYLVDVFLIHTHVLLD
jgi:hypothetical protein